jgi:diguanylate cyclase (GGDEF)-like protein/PAS domain S-box-containing protein
MNKLRFNVRSLHIQVSLSVAIAALLVMIISASYFYKRSYAKSLNESERSIQQLLKTVSTTAAIAAYVDNKELAQEVLAGLTKNDIVLGAQIHTKKGVIGFQGNNSDLLEKKYTRLLLKAPFDETEVVGELRVVANQPLISQRAESSAKTIATSLAAQATIVALLVSLLVYWMITKPLANLSKRLHLIVPGDKQRLDVIRRHNQNEIGLLIGDINLLLKTVDNMLEDERQLRRKVELLEHRFRSIFEDSSAGIFLVHDDGQLITANPAFYQLIDEYADSDSSPTDNLNIFTRVFVEPDQGRSLVKLALISQRPSSCDLQIVRGHSTQTLWVHCIFSPAGDEQHLAVVEGVMYDITERKQSEERNRELAEKDALTGLANRQAVEIVIKELIRIRPTENAAFTIMLIDLDRFKYVNDTYGHDAGDWVLKVVAERLRFRVRHSDIVARIGGDEFLILLRHTDHLERVREIAKLILEEQQKAIEVQPGFYEAIGMSIGIAQYSAKDDTELSIRKHADQAMYAVKRLGKNGYAIYNASGDYELYTHPKKITS